MGNNVTESAPQFLTEEDPLAMPDENYMNLAQFNFFLQQLTVMQRELTENAKVTGAYRKGYGSGRRSSRSAPRLKKDTRLSCVCVTRIVNC